MSDANKVPGDPIEEPRPVDDVVVRAQEGLADAEAAQREISADEYEAQFADAGGDPAAVTRTTVVESETVEPVEPVVVEPVASESVTTAYAAPLSSEAETTAYAPVTPSEPVVDAAVVAPAAVASPQPIFVQAPEAPNPRGNRAAAGLIGLLAALSFAVLYLACSLGFGLIQGTFAVDELADQALVALQSWWLWVPTAIFWIGFWLLGAIINRGRWAHWVIWGVLIGFVAYGGHIVGQLFQAPFWSLTRGQGADLVESQLVAPLAFAAFVIGRELTIWFGAWVAARGQRVTALNTEALREYERTLEAGPTLVRQ